MSILKSRIETTVANNQHLRVRHKQLPRRPNGDSHFYEPLLADGLMCCHFTLGGAVQIVLWFDRDLLPDRLPMVIHVYARCGWDCGRIKN